MQLSGELRQWHKITLDFTGPALNESAAAFRDHRLDVTFVNKTTGTTMTVPGYFAADGDAANTSATSGNVWRAHFNPPETGEWTWEASFRTGRDVAVSDDPRAGAPVASIDGSSGSFSVAASDKTGDDLRGKGTLQYDGDQYLNFAGDGSVFLKSGVGSPENFLAYKGFDDTPWSHQYTPHVGDYRSGDPTWAGGEGKGIIGAVNYLAEHEVNSAYMILMNVGGDGRDVWPWSDPNLDDITQDGNNIDLTSPAWSFDVSKLAQWETVFEHMQEKGIAMHLFLQETENDAMLNDGWLGLERMLYMREMVARFGHHNGVIFNLGEENTNSTEQLTYQSEYLKSLDPYGHAVALHTYPSRYSMYEAFEGSETLDVLSFQTDATTEVPDLDRYLGGAEAAGRPVVAFIDEPGNAYEGILPDGASGWETNHSEMRDTLWRFYTEGGSGAEWYFGFPRGDLGTEDFSQRESVYAWSAAARRFFENLPLEGMDEGDALTTGTVGDDDVIARPGEVYTIYLADGGSATLDLNGQSGSFDVRWYDVIAGSYHEGTVASVSGGGWVDLGTAPYASGNQWAVLVTADGVHAPEPEPQPEPEPDSDFVMDGSIYRWNAGPSTVAASDGGPDWIADTGAVTGATSLADSSIATSGTLDASVPGTTPKGVFSDYYWGSSADSGMGLEFGDGALEAGSYAVRLYMGNGYEGTDDAGERVFDVRVEDELFLDDVDLSGTLGHEVGGMFEWRGEVTDGTLDIDFGHVVENPLVNGVEILRLDGAEPQPEPEGGVVHRWNAGPDTVAATDGGPAWIADAGAVTGAARLGTSPIATSGTLDASVPETAPADIFAHYYWGSSAGNGMGLEFGDGALEAGSYAVRLYMGNGYAGTDDAGERVFDVRVEDELFLDDVDLSGTLGHEVGGMFEWRGEVTDGTLDIDFGHVVENPLVNAVEVIRLDGSGSGGTGGLSFDLALAHDDGRVIDADVTDGEVLSLDTLEDLTFVATPSAAVGSVRMELVGVHETVENTTPYVLFGDLNGEFLSGRDLPAGDYEMRLTAYSEDDGRGDMLGAETIAFEIADEFLL